MYFFNFSLKKAFLILALLAMPVFLMTVERSWLESTMLFRSLFYLTGRGQVFYQSVSNSISQTAGFYFHLLSLKQTNRKLQKENKQLTAELTLLEEVKNENTRLKRILQFSRTKPRQFIFAAVSGRDPLSQYQLLTVNRGSRHGVAKNMPVIAEDGFVGYVFRVHDLFSHIILITDPHAAAPALVQRSRVQGVLEGMGRGTARLKYLKRRDDVKMGDIIVTARPSPTLTGGFPIGQVTQITKETYGLTQTITVTPFINPAQIEEVLIVKHKGLQP